MGQALGQWDPSQPLPPEYLRIYDPGILAFAEVLKTSKPFGKKIEEELISAMVNEAERLSNQDISPLSNIQLKGFKHNQNLEEMGSMIRKNPYRTLSLKEFKSIEDGVFERKLAEFTRRLHCGASERAHWKPSQTVFFDT